MENQFYKYYESCKLCPRECGVDRTRLGRGYCGMPAEIYAGRAALHMWEEPCISGRKGSGAVFFSGCNMRCVFCQNYRISSERRGNILTAESLAEIFLSLQGQGANNINLVTAGHYLPSVAAAIAAAKGKGLKIPVVYNSSGYEKPEMLEMLDGLVDIYLPDLKYLSRERAEKYSQAPDYPKTAKAALREMVRQAGAPRFDGRGMMEKGVIVRHLMLPGGYMDSRRVLRYLHGTYGNDIYISIMSQYTPVRYIKEHPELNRKVRGKEYEKLLDYAISIGVEQAFYQEGETAAESFIPDFDGTGCGLGRNSNMTKM